MCENVNVNEKMNEVVEFECIYGTASFSGFVNVEDLDDDEPLWFYDSLNQPQSHLQNAGWEGTSEDKQKLYEAFTEDFQFVQFLSDFASDPVTINRGGYTIRVNGGTQLEVSYEKVGNFSRDTVEGTYEARVRFSFGDTVLEDALLEELASDVGSTWNDTNFRVEDDDAIIVEVDMHFFDEDADFSSEKKEMESDIENMFVRQLVMDKGAFVHCWDAYSDYLIETDSFHKFDDTIKGAVANNFEQQLESESLVDIDNICSDEMIERINHYIKSDEY